MKKHLTRSDQHRERTYRAGYRQGQHDRKRGLSLHLISHKDFLTHRILRSYQAGYIDGYFNRRGEKEEVLVRAA